MSKYRKRLPLIHGSVVLVIYNGDRVLSFFFSWSIIRLEDPTPYLEFVRKCQNDKTKID